jgi:hypothetical protein
MTPNYIFFFSRKAGRKKIERSKGRNSIKKKERKKRRKEEKKKRGKEE